MFERRSHYFSTLFSSLGIGFDTDTSGRIDNNKVLVFAGQPIRLYFNEATDKRGAYFALGRSRRRRGLGRSVRSDAASDARTPTSRVGAPRSE